MGGGCGMGATGCGTEAAARSVMAGMNVSAVGMGPSMKASLLPARLGAGRLVRGCPPPSLSERSSATAAATTAAVAAAAADDVSLPPRFLAPSFLFLPRRLASVN